MQHDKIAKSWADVATSHLINGFRQGMVSAVPLELRKSWASAPEASEFPLTLIYEMSSSRGCVWIAADSRVIRMPDERGNRKLARQPEGLALSHAGEVVL